MDNEQLRDLQFCKDLLIREINKIVEDYSKLQEKLTQEVVVSVIYLKVFSAYIQEKKFITTEEAWAFMNDMSGIVEKISYINSYFKRVKDSLKIA